MQLGPAKLVAELHGRLLPQVGATSILEYKTWFKRVLASLNLGAPKV